MPKKQGSTTPTPQAWDCSSRLFAVRHRHASVYGLPLNPQHAAPYPTWQDPPAGPVPLPGPPSCSSQRVLKAQNQITTSSCSTPSPRAWELDPDMRPPATHPLEYTQLFKVSSSLWTLIDGADTPLFPVNRMQLFRYLPFSPQQSAPGGGS